MFQTFTGREYLKIDIASNFGLDKVSWDERIAWFDQHQNELDDHLPSAKEPALYYAGVKAWREIQAGEPTGYLISLDATSSGMQLLAALTGDRSCAELCNVVDLGSREDAYTGIYQRMLEQLGETAQITREDTKRAIMTAFYSSKAVPKEVFGEGALLDTFYDVLSEVAPAAWELNEAFLAMWDPEALSNDWVLPDNFHVHIKVMSPAVDTVHFLNGNYEVTYKVNAPVEGGRSLGANTVHSIDGMVVREMTRRCDYDPETVARVLTALDALEEAQGDKTAFQRLANDRDKMVCILWDHYLASGYLSARILDYLENANIGHIEPGPIRDLLGSLPDKPFKVISIHDCFRCLPHYGNDLRRQYNLQLQLIAKSNLLGHLISQIVGHTVKVGKLDPTLSNDVIDTNYALS